MTSIAGNVQWIFLRNWAVFAFIWPFIWLEITKSEGVHYLHPLNHIQTKTHREKRMSATHFHQYQLHFNQQDPFFSTSSVSSFNITFVFKCVFVMNALSHTIILVSTKTLNAPIQFRKKKILAPRFVRIVYPSTIERLLLSVCSKNYIEHQ